MNLEFQKLIDTSFVFTKRDLKERYASSILGPLWIVLYPLLLMGVVTIVFSFFFSNQILGVPYSLFVLTGFIHWIYFSQSVSYLTRSFLNQRNLIANAKFPLLAILISVIISRFIDYLVGFTLLIILLLIFHQLSFFKLLLIIPLILFQTLMQLGLGLIFASLNMIWRDIQYLVDVGIQILFYVTPIIYTLEIVPSHLHNFFLLNPLVLFFTNYQNILLKSEINWLYFLLAAVISLLVLFLGVIIFKKYRYVIPELS